MRCDEVSPSHLLAPLGCRLRAVLRETSSLLVSKANASVTDVVSEDAGLSLEVFNDSQLVAVESGGVGRGS